MMDRSSTKVLPNGAIRYGVYDEAENFLRYEYIKLQDEPTQAGMPICKETMLKDATAEALGLTPATAVPDDAFLALYIGAGKYGYRIHATFANGAPISNKVVSGLTTILGGTVTTDASGNALGVSTSKTPTISMDFSNYLDVASFSQQAQSTGIITDINIVIARTGSRSASITASRTVTFSPMTSKFDVALIGGGGSGGGYGSGGGGGGYVTNSFGTNNPNLEMTLQVGGGGWGSDGGATSLICSGLNLVANGGKYAANGRSGNGNGGDSYAKGGDRYQYPFNETAIPCSGGGGGGGYNSMYPAQPGGSSYGGAGAMPGANGQDGLGYGGGGGGAGQSSSTYGKGYPGVAMFRWS